MSLRTKVLLPLATFSALFLAYLYGYWMPRSLANIEAGYRQSIERHLESVEEGLIPLLLAHQLDAVYENLDSLMKNNRDWIELRLVGPDGAMLYPLSVPAASMARGKNVHVIERPIVSLDKNLGSLALIVDFAPRLDQIRKRHWEMMIVTLAGILLFVAVTAFVLNAVVIRPINVLSHASRRLAENDFEAPLRKTGGDEVGVLIDDFEAMRRAMREYRSRLQLAHEQVERELEERRRTEAELKRLTLRTEMILNSAGEGIYGTDVDGNIVFLNRAAEQMLGFSTADAAGKNSHLLFHHTKADGTPFPLGECPVGKALALAETYRAADDIFWTRDGKSLPVEHVNTPLLDRGGIVGAVVVFRDITERKRSEAEIRTLNESLEKRVAERTGDLQKKSDELRDSRAALMNIVEDLNEKTIELRAANEKLKGLDQLKSLFIASMSHELRTPLNSIIGFSSILLNEWTGPLSAEQKDNLGSVLRSGRHLLALINDVIDVSKIEAGKLEFIPETFDLSDVLAEAAQAVSAEIRAKGLTLTIQEVRREMRTDRRRLLQCLLNLLSNAAKFTEKGTISVSATTAADGDSVELSVADSGIGMGEDEMQKLFSPFVRLNSPMKATVPGTGLGLYLTRKLVREVLLGDILVTSTAGQGSTFTLVVPARPEGRAACEKFS